MKIWLKVIVISILVVIAIVGAIVFMFKKLSKVETLSFNTHDSVELKIDKTRLWLSKLHQNNKFNGAILVIKNDSVLIKDTYGYTDYTREKKLNNESSFRLASLSKQFTATGIMLLKEQNKLNFDDTITTYLPELKYSTVTIRNLLNHTSGIPDVYMSFPKKYKQEIGDFLTIQKMINLLSKENLPLKNEPNEKYNYNNTGYVLLAGIIERVSKTSFENFMQKELFEKLKMKNTRVWNLASKEKDFLNKTHSFENVFGEITKLSPSVLDGVAGDGGFFSSIDDFVIWNKFWNENALISKKTKEEAFKQVQLNDGSISNYGFGWIILNKVASWHNGSWLGARTLFIRNEALKNCIVILDNSSSMAVDNIAKQLVKVLK